MTALPHSLPQLATPRPPLNQAGRELLDRARASLLAACRTSEVTERYVDAHLGALRAAAALLAARSAPATRSSRPRSVWEILPRLAPELAEWADFFAASARQRAAIGRGQPISTRAADDLLREAETFLGIVQELLGVPATAPLPGVVAPAAGTSHPPGAVRE